MRKGSKLVPAVLLFLLFTGAACKKAPEGPDLSQLGPSSAATSTVLPVGSPLCPGGGTGVYAGKDANANGVLDASEIKSGAPVCNPPADDGRPAGLVSLVMVASEPSGTVHCPAGGLKVLSGPDADRNGILDAGEVAFTEYLCNGAPGASSAAGITVAVEPPAPPADVKKKSKKQAAQARPGGAAGTAPAKAASRPAAEAPAGTAAPAKKAAAATAPPNREKGGSAKPAAPPKGWTAVKGNPELARVAYKVEGRYITVRFTNLSAASSLRFKYTVRWKVNQNGAWVDDSTMEGIGFRLQPQETLDREVRVQTQDIRDVVVDLDVLETS